MKALLPEVHGAGARAHLLLAYGASLLRQREENVLKTRFAREHVPALKTEFRKGTVHIDQRTNAMTVRRRLPHARPLAQTRQRGRSVVRVELDPTCSRRTDAGQRF